MGDPDFPQVSTLPFGDPSVRRKPNPKENQMPKNRFTLNEAKAAKWLATSVAAYNSGEEDETVPPEQQPEIGGNYSPGNDERDTAHLVMAARYAGVVAGPGAVLYDIASDDEECGYTWIVYLDGPRAPKLSTGWLATRHLAGARELRGAEAALAVLREGVARANDLMDDLDAYIASR